MAKGSKGGKKSKGKSPGEQLVCSNPKAGKLYDIEQRFEMGMVLAGSEVKSLRDGRADLEGAYAAVDNGELWLHRMHIGPYRQATAWAHEAKSRRKLLAKKSEINKLQGRLSTKGYALVPIKVYFKNGWAKVQLGLGKGKKLGDKRQDLKRKADMREARKALKKG